MRLLVANPFVYEKTLVADIRNSHIPAMLEPYYGQCGEDLIIFSLIRALYYDDDYDWSNYVSIEIGANHAFSGSNTFLLEEYLGVKTILVEANQELLFDLQKARPASKVIHAAIVANDIDSTEFYISYHNELSSLDENFIMDWHDGNIGISHSIKVPAMRINKLLENHVDEKEIILFLSIDVEGKDLQLVKDLDLSRWRPVIMQMEPSEHYLPNEDNKMISYMTSQNYILIGRTNVNLIFIDEKILFRKFNLDERF